MSISQRNFPLARSLLSMSASPFDLLLWFISQALTLSRQNLCPDKLPVLLAEQCHHAKTVPFPGCTGDQEPHVMLEFVLVLVQNRNEAN